MTNDKQEAKPVAHTTGRALKRQWMTAKKPTGKYSSTLAPASGTLTRDVGSSCAGRAASQPAGPGWRVSIATRKRAATSQTITSRSTVAPRSIPRLREITITAPLPGSATAAIHTTASEVEPRRRSVVTGRLYARPRQEIPVGSAESNNTCACELCDSSSLASG